MFNNIIKRSNFRIILALHIATTCVSTVNAQNTPGLQIIKKYNQYKQTVKDDSLKRMVELKTIVPDIQYDIRYATLNNFMNTRLYESGEFTYLRLPVAQGLAKVQHELHEKGFLLKIWDAYRPYSVTVKMWEPIKDDRYVADPKVGSGHNRGTAVDLTIIDMKTGKELNMGTGYDNFTDTAHQTFKSLPQEILQNRLLLKNLMEKYGFTALKSEWWHFYWNKANDFELMDIPFKKFK